MIFRDSSRADILELDNYKQRQRKKIERMQKYRSLGLADILDLDDSKQRKEEKIKNS